LNFLSSSYNLIKHINKKIIGTTFSIKISCESEEKKDVYDYGFGGNEDDSNN
jgi:hypothetical protein